MSAAQYVKWTDVTAEEIWAFFGFMILMGINQLPALRDYWKLDPTYRYNPIASKITRDRFLEILRYIHFVDNTTLLQRPDPAYDKLGKIRPVIDHLSEQFLSAYNPHQQVSIDEAMVAFKGRSSMKQYIPKKPIKRGFKAWVRADAVTGYVSEFDIYTGKVPGERQFGLGGNVVKRLTRKITGKNHVVYCDNFFTSASLFSDLLKDKIYSCGTYNRTRKCYPQSLKATAKSGLKNRGDYMYRQCGNLLVSLWQDTKTLSCLSTNECPSEVTARRRQKDGTHAEIPCPLAIKVYNKFMGGVDKNDQLRRYYSIRTKSRKCYKYLFWFLFDVAIVNSFILYGLSPAVGRQKTLKDFRVELANQMIGSYNSRKHSGRTYTRETQRAKRMRVPHYPIKTTQRRCRKCSKENKRTTSTWWCNDCKLRLCHTGVPTTDCFLRHHLSSGLYEQ